MSHISHHVKHGIVLRVVNEGEHVVVNQVVEEVDPSVEVGFDIGGTTPEPDFFRQRRQALDAFKPTLCFTKLFCFCFYLLH